MSKRSVFSDMSAHDDGEDRAEEGFWRLQNIYESALDNTPDFVYVIGLDYRFIYANKSLLDMWGQSKESAVGKNLLELGYEPWHAHMHEREIDEIVKTKKAIRGEVPFSGMAGKRMYDYIFSPVFDKHGQVIAIAGTTRDVTERMETERALKQSEERIELALNSGAVLGTWVWDVAHDIVMGDERFMRTFYLDKKSGLKTVSFQDAVDAIHPDDAEGVKKIVADAVQRSDVFRAEYRVRSGDGWRWVEASGAIERDAQGRATRFPGVIIDIDERKLMEQELRRLNESLELAKELAEAANIAKTEFLANMSHEIRTPMNAIIGLSNILALSRPVTLKQREFIETLQMSADSLLTLINDLLDIAKIEARTIELEHIPFSLERLMQEVISMMAVQVKEKGLAFTGDSKRIQGRMFKGDPARLRQIIINLCSNAIKFTDKGTVHVSITCRPLAGKDMEEVCIAVTDSGIGIAPDKLDTIFQKFVQGDTSINRKYGGTGLGLTITKTLSEIMGGTIGVHSELSEGSTFKVCIPLEVASEEERLQKPEKLPDAVPLAQNAKKSILLVEDYEPNVLVAKTFLEQFGYDVDVASSGQEAFDKVKKHPFIAIMMDVQMHGINGLDATVMIRNYEKQERRARLPIIGMTAHALAGDRERCLSAGMDDYIAKPFNPEELREKIILVITRVGTQQ